MHRQNTTYVGKENILDRYVDEKDWKQRLKPFSIVFQYRYQECRGGCGVTPASGVLLPASPGGRPTG